MDHVNVVPERGWLAPTSQPASNYHRWQRVWELVEFADKPELQCRWVATATLYAHSIRSSADFRLHALHRQNVVFAVAKNKDGFAVFDYHCTVDEIINCFVDSLPPSHGTWWFWPMETILDYDTLRS